MRFKQLLGRTLREAPAEAERASHQLLMRAALARPLASGLWAYLPLGWRAIDRLAEVVRQEMRALDCHELRVPALQPADIWQATGRWETFGPALQRLRNRDGQPFALAAAHEEVTADLARREIDSHRQLPWHGFQIGTRFRDDPHPHDGLINLREFIAHDACSLHADREDLRHFSEEIVAAYERLLARCEVSFRAVAALNHPDSDGEAVEFMLSHPQGENAFVTCDRCDYAAAVETAVFKPSPGAIGEAGAMEKVATPGADTIAGLADFLNIPTYQTLKAVFYTRKEDYLLVFALLRGDLDIDEKRLSHAVGGGTLRPATDDEIESAGASAGFASPVGLNVRPGSEASGGVLVVGDPSIQEGVNFASGANEDGYHYVNVNYPRDFAVTAMVAIAAVPDRATCAQCGGTLHRQSADTLGACRQLGTSFSQRVGATYLDEGGQSQHIFMGGYWLGLDRLLAAIVETHRDEHGITWPLAVAPLPVHLLTLGKGDDVREAADQLYAALAEAGIEALYDDRRDESAGVKFNDADLIGLPLRLTVGARGLKEGVVEVKWRMVDERETVPLAEVVDEVAARLSSAQGRKTSS